jgi:predicted DNA-binding transcriptional regulator YafY
MNRTDRLLAIVLELQGARRRRAEDLAATFETSKRTIYRDIEALCEAGVPIVAVPGRGYSLMEGYFLPPVTFSADEAAILLLGSDVMAQSFDAQYRAAAQGAARKIEAVLPAPLAADVAGLRRSIHFVTSRQTAGDELLVPLRGAVADCTRVRFAYHSRGRSDGSAPRREVDPYALAHVGGAWYLRGHDHLRDSVRTFRLSRMDDLAVLETRFERPPFTPMRAPGLDERPVEVRILFDRSVARWVRETPSFFTVGTEETPGGFLVTLRVREEREVLGWVLQWGRHAEVLAPDGLRVIVRAEVTAMAEQYAGSPTEG